MATRQNKRRSTTFAQRTNAHLKAIERKLNPQPTFGPISIDPPAITNQGRFIDRTIFVTTANDKLTIGDISRSLKGTDYGGSGPSGDFYIRNIKIWGAGTPNVTLVVNFILANLLVSGGTTADPVSVRDIGTNSRCPGVRCSIPFFLSLVVAVPLLLLAQLLAPVPRPVLWVMLVIVPLVLS